MFCVGWFQKSELWWSYQHRYDIKGGQTGLSSYGCHMAVLLSLAGLLDSQMTTISCLKIVNERKFTVLKKR